MMITSATTARLTSKTAFAGKKEQAEKTTTIPSEPPAGQVYGQFTGAHYLYYLVPPGSESKINAQYKRDLIQKNRQDSAWAIIQHDPQLFKIREDLFKLINTGKLPKTLEEQQSKFERLPAIIDEAQREAKKYTTRYSGSEGRQWRATNQLMQLLAEQVAQDRYGLNIAQLARKNQSVYFPNGQDKPETRYNEGIPNKVYTQDVISYVPMGSDSLKAGSKRIVNASNYSPTIIGQDQLERDRNEVSYYIPTQLVRYDKPVENTPTGFVLSNEEVERAKTSANGYGAGQTYDRSILNPIPLDQYPADDPKKLKDLKDA